MTQNFFSCAAAMVLLLVSHAVGQNDVAVPDACTPEVNTRLSSLLRKHPSHNVDNVMVCGVTVSKSRTQRGGPHGDHQVLALRVVLPDGTTAMIEIVTNDSLDGLVSAPRSASVTAYGQMFIPGGGRFAAGIHEVHCATHSGADNGWVVVDGTKFPASCR